MFFFSEELFVLLLLSIFNQKQKKIKEDSSHSGCHIVGLGQSVLRKSKYGEK